MRLGNGEQAARLAGYEAKHLRQYASKLLTKPDICERLDELRAEAREKLAIDEERVLNRLAAIAFGNIDTFTRWTDHGEPIIDPTKGTTEERAAIKRCRVTYGIEGAGEDARDVLRVDLELRDPMPALVKLCERLGLTRDSTGDVADATMALARELQHVMTGNSPFPIATAEDDDELEDED